VFVDVFKGTNLATVSQADLKNMETMRSAAETAETNFNAAVTAAGGTKSAAGESQAVVQF